VAALVSLGVLPQTWKFFWAPVVDATLDQKKWCLLAGIPTAVAVAVMGFLPPTRAGLAALSAAVFVSSVASTLIGMSVESLMAHSTPEELKGRAGGWFQAGNLGGTGVGGGLGLFLAQHLPSPWMASCIVGGLCLGCSVFVYFAGVATPARLEHRGGIWSGLGATLKDLWQVLWSRNGVLVLMLCTLPLGTGAASNLWSAVATEWRASADTVAVVTGVMGGLISAAGCLTGGWVCDRMGRKAAYAWFGIAQASVAVAMALLPREPYVFVVGSSVYAFTNGLAYAAFSAFVLEAIGKGAAATKYSALASLSNVPIYYMTTVDGWAHDRWNSTGMLLVEAGLGVAAAVAFGLAARWLTRTVRQHRPTPSAPTSSATSTP
jgi:MFS family permease